MRDARNIHEVSQLGIDWIGLDFIPNSERYVSQIASCAGIIPDYSSLSDLSSDKLSQQKEGPVLCGVFADTIEQRVGECFDFLNIFSTNIPTYKERNFPFILSLKMNS